MDRILVIGGGSWGTSFANYLASQGLSSLKHFAPHLKTLTICKFFHSNADASFPNMKDEEWLKYLAKMAGQ